MNPKNCSTIHSQFNHHTLPVTLNLLMYKVIIKIDLTEPLERIQDESNKIKIVKELIFCHKL